jgi:hypothetical protein
MPRNPGGSLGAMIVKILDEKAGREFVAFNGWDTNHWQDDEVRSFLGRFPDPVL